MMIAAMRRNLQIGEGDIVAIYLVFALVFGGVSWDDDFDLASC